MTGWVLTVHEPQAPPRRVPVRHRTEVGRDVDGVVVDDPTVSRRHLAVSPATDGLLVTDLGSANGTTVDGARIDAEAVVPPGRTVRAGHTELEVEAAPAPPPPPGPDAGAAPPLPPHPAVSGRPAPPMPPAPESDAGVRTLDANAVIIHYREGSPGAEVVRRVARNARRARSALAGLGSADAGWRPTVHLVDPFPRTDDPSRLMTSGAMVDPERGELWMVVTAESPPEPLERGFVLLFGAALPAADELWPLLEGYGLHLAGSTDRDEELAATSLPRRSEAEGELGAAMAASFVRFLIGKLGEATVRELFEQARPGAVDATARELSGRSLLQLEADWRGQLQEPAPRLQTREFARLALTYLRPHRRRQVEVGLYMVLGLGFTMVFPFVTQALFDEAIPSGDFGEVTDLLLLLAAVFAVSLLAGLRRNYLSAYISSAVVRDVRQRMFDHLQSLSTDWFQRHQQGDVTSRLFNDVGLMERGLSRVLRDGIFQVLHVVVASVVLLSLDLVLGAVVVLGAPLVALVYRLMGSGARRRSLTVQEQRSGLMSIVSENYQAEPVVKLFGLEERERSRLARAAERLFAAEVRLNLFGGLFGLSVNAIVAVLRLTVLGFGAWLVLNGQMTLGTLVAFLGIMGEVITPITTLTGVGEQLQRSAGAMMRIKEVLDREPGIADRPDAVELGPVSRELELGDVAFGYDPDTRVLDGVDATIPAGSQVAFVGPSGSGKSTVLSLLMRFYDPDEGSVRADGTDLRAASLSSLRGQLGVVLQDSFLFDVSVGENIALGRVGATREQVEAAARAADIHETILELPHGYDTPVGARGANLSGGQRQRVALARALIRDPRVLLLDEATSALDPGTERRILDTLERVGEGRTTVSITHRLTSVVGYDRIYVLEGGRIAEQGTHEDLVADGGLYARMWAEQTGEVVPSGPSLDVPAALRRTTVFSGLDEDGRSEVAERLRSVELHPGQLLHEGGGRLSLVARGRLRVMAPDLGGQLVEEAELTPGDAFGVSALLGDARGAVAQAVEASTVLVLGDEQLRGLAARHPSVAAALSHGGGAAPSGRQLGRATFAAGPGGRADGRGASVVAEATGGVERAVDAPPGTPGSASG